MPEFWIDVGGTFTDCIGRTAGGGLSVHKLLSSGVYAGVVGLGSTRDCIVDPRRAGDSHGFFAGWTLELCESAKVRTQEGARSAAEVPAQRARVERFDAPDGRLALTSPLQTDPRPGQRYELRCDLEAPVVGVRWLMGKPLDVPVGPVRMKLGTTRGTNALLEHKGAPTALVTTRGFADILRIGDQTRPKLFELNIRKPAPLYCEVVELDERMDARGDIVQQLDEQEVRDKLAPLRVAGIVSLAVCLLNSYRNPAHERLIERVARPLGFECVSLSSTLSPLQRMIPRGETAVIDAYLTPVMRTYVGRIRAALPEAELKLMTSAGGLVDAAEFVAKDSVLSGPAGGVVGCAHVAKLAGFERVIGFDMGGTSTDVSRYDGEFERRREMLLEDAASSGTRRIVGDMLAIETVAAGGGSICGFDGVKPTVGPQSAGAEPGPACYGRGGPLCVTDVNLYLGRISGRHFALPIDRDVVERRLDERVAEIARATGRRYTPDQLAAGYLAIANSHMAAAIRRVSVARGYDPREYTLVSFGGAGGQHACAIARELGIRTILLHPLAGVLSALGIGVADVTRTAARDVRRPLGAGADAILESQFAEMEGELRSQVRGEGVGDGDTTARRLLDLRYEGQATSITVAQPSDESWGAAFEGMHAQLYGFALPGRTIEVYAARVEVIGHTPKPEATAPADTGTRGAPQPVEWTDAFFDSDRRSTPVFDRDGLRPGHAFDGPAIVLEATGTVVVEPGWRARVSERGDIVLTDSDRGGSAGDAASVRDGDECDPVTLELFNNRFAAIAEQMGATLERTALSTNVKERRDFSCAVYDARGDLVANAPHMPVHLGAMGHCVRCLLDDVRAAGDALRPGDVWLTNDPYRGGSHLPDLTTITPVFDDAGAWPLFYVANRAHHAEIGGVLPGSMPPNSRTLAEEGVVIRARRIVEAAGAGAAFYEDALHELLTAGQYPSRAVEQNIADIRAQVAANQCGVSLLRGLVARFGDGMVQHYMGHIQRAAETKMRAALRRLGDGEYAFTDHLDDGTPIAVRIGVRDGRAVVDFTGSGAVHPGNLNATPAIVSSAVLYCCRCLIDEDIPLNAGVLAPIEIILPEGLLNPPRRDDPAHCPAVVGGNVETSQRIVDVVFGALGVVAASQGTMNNVTFGNERFGYYETIGGGAGAGPTFDGADAVHTHMTNTRLTDPEVLEDRYPVRVRRFAVRRGSGGAGAHRGGDGIVREIEFLEPVTLSLLTQRRTRPPYGLSGGADGLPGHSTLRRRNGETVALGPAASADVASGDVLRIETPGGGGYA